VEKHDEGNRNTGFVKPFFTAGKSHECLSCHLLTRFRDCLSLFLGLQPALPGLPVEKGG